LFAGGAGSDELRYVLQQAGTAQTYAVGTGLGLPGAGAGMDIGTAEGEILTEIGALVQRLYFTGLEPIIVTGDGTPLGTLTLLGDPDDNLITVRDNLGADSTHIAIATLAAGTHIFETLGFAANTFTQLIIRSLAGNDRIELQGYDPVDTYLALIELVGGLDDDHYVISDNWRTVLLTENVNEGDDTLDFTPATVDLVFTFGDLYSIKFVVTGGGSLVTHWGDYVEHFVGGQGNDWFVLTQPGMSIAGGKATIVGGPGYDTIDYSAHARYSAGVSNGDGLAQAADVEDIVKPPTPPRAKQLIAELLGGLVDHSLDEIIFLLRHAAQTKHLFDGETATLDLNDSTTVMTLLGTMVVLPGGSGKTVTVSDARPHEIEAHYSSIQAGKYFINLSGDRIAFSPNAFFARGVSIRVSGNNLGGGNPMVVTFDSPVSAPGTHYVIMAWDAVLGIWCELETIVTPGGYVMAFVDFPGTFILVAK